MSTKTPQLDWREWGEGRRRRAWELKQQGWKQQDIAAALGVTPGAVSSASGSSGDASTAWRGCGAIRPRVPRPSSRPHQGPNSPPCWSAGPRPTASGARSGPASGSRRSSAAPSASRPIPPTSADCCTRCGSVSSAREQAADEGRTVVWVDQASFSLLPMAVRTWAPRGQTPTLTAPLTHDHLAASSGITPAGRVCMQTQERA
jgi:hypothetical protein